MPRYFFDVLNVSPNISPSTDHIGQELPSDEAAWREATVFAGEIFKDADGKMRPDQEWELRVSDQGRSPLFDIQINTRKLK